MDKLSEYRMNQFQHFAQKGIIVNENNQILLNRYTSSKYLSAKLTGKLCLPGGRVDFGDHADESFTREIQEETGLIVEPGQFVYVWDWVYEKEDGMHQIFAAARLARYVSGEPLKPIEPSAEVTLEMAHWYDFDSINYEDFVFDEVPALQIYQANRHKYD